VIKLTISILGIILVGFLLVLVLAKTQNTAPASKQQTQQLQAVTDGAVFSH
jgi:hypothetical protein